LTLDGQAASRQFNREAFVVRIFEQPGTKFVVHFQRCSDDFFGEGVECLVHAPDSARIVQRRAR